MKYQVGDYAMFNLYNNDNACLGICMILGTSDGDWDYRVRLLKDGAKMPAYETELTPVTLSDLDKLVLGL